ADRPAAGHHRRAPLRRRLRWRPPGRGASSRQGAHFQPAQRVRTGGAAQAAARAVDPLQRQAQARRARAGVPAVELDRGRCVALHRQGGHRAAVHLLRARARGVSPRRHVADRGSVGRAAGRRAGRPQDGALPHARRRPVHRRRGIPSHHRRGLPRRSGRRRLVHRRRGIPCHHRRGRHRGGVRVPPDRAWGDQGRRPAVRSRDGGPQARGVFLIVTSLLRLATAGSVDDGKSTLVGRLLYDTKSVLADQLDAVTRASVDRGLSTPDLSLLVDGLRSEREQGITIDVAYRYFATPKRTFVLADTPGHVQYTRNTVTGASTAQLAILLVDARNGVIEQTRRHAAVLALLGVRRLVLAVNKIDLVDFDEATFTTIADEFTAHATALGYAPDEVQAIPV